MTKQQSLTEFDVIGQFFSGIGFTSSAATAADSVIELGMGDDCALLSLAAGQQLALSIDTLVAGRHFPHHAPADELAWRALAVSVSDLAAMGAKPLAFTLALTLPAIKLSWLQAFSNGLRAAADFYRIALIGGDTTQGPLSISLQVHGSVAAGTALNRAGAQAGDSIFVSGSLGDAAAALALLNKNTVTDAAEKYLLARYYRPQARIELGLELVSLANAAIDISDGLLADLEHIAKASGLAARVDSWKVPLSSELNAIVSPEQALHYALTGGDDYELCFTAAAEQRQSILALSDRVGVAITEIGSLLPGAGVSCLNQQGDQLDFDQLGFQHFQP